MGRSRRPRPRGEKSGSPRDTQDNGGLHEAAIEGDRDRIEVLLEGGADPNAKAEDSTLFSRTPLALACQNGHEEVVELLLQQEGIIADARDDNGQTPLSLAAEHGHEGVVIHLLEADVDINSTDHGGDTPLLHSIRNEHEYVSRRLLDSEQIDPNRSNSLGEAPLSIAILKDDVNLVLVLLSRDDIEPDTTDHNNMTPVLLAAQSDNELILGQLVSNHTVNINARDNTGRTALTWAASKGNARAVQLLLTDDVDRNPVDMYGDTPLLEAAREGHREAVYYLSRDKGVDINFKDANGRTALSWASDKGYPSVVNSLLERDATDPNLIDDRGYSPLHYAVTGGRRDIVQRLLQRDDIDPNTRDVDGETTLLHAVKQKRHDLVKPLLEHKCTDPNVKDRGGRTGLSYAMQDGDDSIVQLFLSRKDVDISQDDGRSALTFALASKDPAIARALLQKRGSQSLHSLIEKGDEVMVGLALSAGLDVSSLDSLCRTPLHMAIAFGHSGIASKLIAAGARVDSEDIHGTTPLHIATRDRNRQLITLLLSKGARTDGIMAEEWFSACGESPSAIMELAENQAGEKTLRFFGPGSFIPDCTGKGLENAQTRRLIRIPTFATFEGGLIPDPECISRNRLQISQRTICGGRGVSVYVAVWFPSGRSSTASCGLQFPDWGKLAISWTAVPPSPSNYGAGWKSVDHFSMLDSGWIPQDGVELFTMFMDCLEQRWVRVCEIVEAHLSNGRVDQLEKRGDDAELIPTLARDAQHLTELRVYLRDQVQAAREFADQYCARYGGSGGQAKVQQAIDRFAEKQNSQINLLDQTVRDMLQFEFAWVSVNEAHKSTSIARSMKRLSWITFVFLPPMFISSIFGMNVNLLSNDPDWRWYLLIAALTLLLTCAATLLFKYAPIEQWVENRTKRLTGSHSAHPGSNWNEAKEKERGGDVKV